MFFGIFLNTLEVKADSGTTATTFTFKLYPSNQDSGPTSLRATVIPSSGVPTTYTFSGNQKDFFDVDIEIPITLNLKNVSDFSSNTGYWSFGTWGENVQLSGSTGYFDVVYSGMYFNDKLTSNMVYARSDEIVKYTSVPYVGPTCIVKFHLSGYTSQMTEVTFTAVLNSSWVVNPISREVYSANAGTVVNDAQVHDDLTDLNDSTDAIEESVTSDTGGGLLATIKNFFGGFFSNLINSILGLFVPSSDYFSTWFNNLNTLLSDKLGMLYAPFDLLISTLNAIYSADTTEPGIVFPGFDWDGHTVIEPFTFYFSSLGEQFQTLREAVYFSTDVIFLFAFLYLMQKKIALVLTGSEVNG